MVHNMDSLINTNNGKKLVKLLSSGTIKPDSEINGHSLIHRLAIQGASDIGTHFFDYVVKKDPAYFGTSDDDGNTALHLFAKYGHTGLLKRYLKKAPVQEYVNNVNNKNESVLHLLNKGTDGTFEWILQKIPNVNVNIITNSGSSLLNDNIKRSSDTTKDRFYSRVELLLDKGASLDSPTNMPPLCCATAYSKDIIVNLLLKRGANPNIMDYNYYTPFLIAIAKQNHGIAQRLIESGANINYNGPDGSKNPLVYLLAHNNGPMVDLMLSHNYDLSNYDKRMETPLHLAFQLDKKLQPEMVAKLIYYGNINSKNIDGLSPLYYFLQKYNWKNYNKILETKPIDIFDGAIPQQTQLSLVNKKDLGLFLLTVATSFVNNLEGTKAELFTDDGSASVLRKNKKQMAIIEGSCHYQKGMIEECLQNVKQFMLEHKRSLPENGDTTYFASQFKMISGTYTNFGKFNADTLHNMIYTIVLLQKYKNLGIPFQFHNQDKMLGERMIYSYNNLYRSDSSKIISDLVKIYVDYFYDITPYLILWKSKDENYAHKDLRFHMLKPLTDPHIRIIFLKLTIIASSVGTHANIVIIDKETGIVERFEPYGNIPYMDNDGLDSFLKDLLEPCLQPYFNKEKPALSMTYLSPKEYMDTSSFQMISNDDDENVRKLGDPRGFCLAWTYWYLETRLHNLDMEPKAVVRMATDSITVAPKTKESNKEGEEGDHLFIDFIRNYANKLDILKNKFLMDAGVTKEHIYNVVFTSDDQEKIIKHMVTQFNAIVAG